MTQLVSQNMARILRNLALLPSSKNSPLWTLSWTNLFQATLTYYELLNCKQIITEQITTDGNDIAYNKQDAW
jgi:hypothetical protein